MYHAGGGGMARAREYRMEGGPRVDRKVVGECVLESRLQLVEARMR